MVQLKHGKRYAGSYSFTSGLQTAIFYIRYDKDYEGESGTSVWVYLYPPQTLSGDL